MWDSRFLLLAENIASWSKDPSTKVGAVIVDQNRRIVSTGYNGFPIGIQDLNFRYDQREIKYSMVIHAEVNAILFSKCDLSGMTLYVSPMMPCSHCASLIIQSGISRIVSYENDNPRWIDSFSISKGMFAEAKIDLVLMVRSSI